MFFSTSGLADSSSLRVTTISASFCAAAGKDPLTAGNTVAKERTRSATRESSARGLPDCALLLLLLHMLRGRLTPIKSTSLPSAAQSTTGQCNELLTLLTVLVKLDRASDKYYGDHTS
jgi:hypothetical protein